MPATEAVAMTREGESLVAHAASRGANLAGWVLAGREVDALADAVVWEEWTDFCTH